MKAFSLLLLCLLTSSCNTTPERRLDEALPGQPVSPMASSPATEASPGPVAGASASPAAPVGIPAGSATAEVIKQGAFRNDVHVVSGRAQLLSSDGKQFVRLEEFSTENGPDLYLYLVQQADGKPRNTDDFVSLGRLRATSGNQNYEIPAGTDLGKIQAVTIWCRAFSVNFGFAPLTE